MPAAYSIGQTVVVIRVRTQQGSIHMHDSNYKFEINFPSFRICGLEDKTLDYTNEHFKPEDNLGVLFKLSVALYREANSYCYKKSTLICREVDCPLNIRMSIGR